MKVQLTALLTYRFCSGYSDLLYAESYAMPNRLPSPNSPVLRGGPDGPRTLYFNINQAIQNLCVLWPAL